MLNLPQKKPGEAYNKVSEKVVNSEVHYNHLAELAESLIKNDMNFLDAGCGNGFLIKRPAETKTDDNKNVNLYAFDALQKMVENLKNSFPSINLNQFLPNTSFGDTFFDKVLYSEVLEHPYSPVEVLKELNRISLSKGNPILSIPNRDSFGIQVVIKNKVVWQPADDVNYTFSELNMYLAESGWRLRSVETIGPIFPRIGRQSLVRKLLIRVTESMFDYFGLGSMRRQTRSKAAQNYTYLTDGSIS